MNKKLRGLLLQVEVMEGSQIQVLNENTFEVDGAEYLVLSEDEREEEFKAYQESLIEDMGLESFSEWAQDYIINNFADDERLEDDLFEIMYESHRNYIEDLRYENTLEEELKENNCEDEDEFLDLLNEEDPKEWYIMNVGEEDFHNMIKTCDYIKWDDVIEWVAREECHGCLAAYDGEELELQDDLYAYRIN